MTINTRARGSPKEGPSKRGRKGLTNYNEVACLGRGVYLYHDQKKSLSIRKEGSKIIRRRGEKKAASINLIGGQGKDVSAGEIRKRKRGSGRRRLRHSSEGRKGTRRHGPINENMGMREKKRSRCHGRICSSPGGEGRKQQGCEEKKEKKEEVRPLYGPKVIFGGRPFFPTKKKEGSIEINAGTGNSTKYKGKKDASKEERAKV